MDGYVLKIIEKGDKVEEILDHVDRNLKYLAELSPDILFRNFRQVLDAAGETELP